MKTILAAAMALLVAVPTLANTVVINGDTTDGPTYNRTLAGEPPTGLSAIGTDVHYQTTAFTVGSDGVYDFNSIAGYDNFLHLYAGSFDPADALANALVGNDDRAVIGISGFAISLLAGTSYFAVASGFENTDFGAYELTIDGPGTISIGGDGGTVPEPASWALMITGFGAVGVGLRRRRATEHQAAVPA